MKKSQQKISKEIPYCNAMARLRFGQKLVFLATL